MMGKKIGTLKACKSLVASQAYFRSTRFRSLSLVSFGSGTLKGANLFAQRSGGLRFAAITGYCLQALRAASFLTTTCNFGGK
jgi:hypothetical protein